ncbi:SDR family oxidoreductase [Truepera radiovictrix]|uniref:Short-chain dehydrogenase/reductase SDR n=1 Tax=Truepera radiovictrix (strain DSM 17093 / CIP 108686 / LMG 22925 / RQ-24) TaxID=649638 RepID=D7CQB7_TRURR|nr:SDR family oxidoreductase [Truepera radiovictrix]ADI14901.1 short-chain dehydrogenase/reductase SDR [Truepera radiovictrix DSM 17093]WMT56547.1 SDR family oxidoreductase [Truepera radiovictrix]
MRTLRDKVILITGAGGTVAGAVEAAFRREGAQLVLIDREAVRVTGRAHSFNTPAFEADLSSFGSAQAVVAQAEAQFGRVDGLVHLVGEVVMGRVDEVHEADFERAFATNVQTLFYTVKAVLPALRRREEAFIAGIAAGEAYGERAAGRSLFAAAKGAVASFLRALDAELQGSHVGVGIIFPMGTVDTRTNRARLSEEAARHLIHPDALARAFVAAALSGEGGTLLELPVYPPRLPVRQVV